MIDLAQLAGEWTVFEHLELVQPGPKQVVNANPRRFALVFSMTAPGGGPVPFQDIIFVSIDPLVGGIGIEVLLGTNVILDFHTTPGLVQKPLFARLTGGLAIANLSILEIIQSANREK